MVSCNADGSAAFAKRLLLRLCRGNRERRRLPLNGRWLLLLFFGREVLKHFFGGFVNRFFYFLRLVTEGIRGSPLPYQLPLLDVADVDSQLSDGNLVDCRCRCPAAVIGPVPSV